MPLFGGASSDSVTGALWRLAGLLCIASLMIRFSSDTSSTRSDGGGGGRKSGTRSRDCERLEAVRKSMKHAWDGYVQFAWGKDELKPVTKSFQDWLGLGLTIVDSLDTLYIMGMHEEFRAAREWVATNLTFERDMFVSTFETSIRVFGGLLSAYDLTKDRMFLERAKDIGDRLAFSMNASKIGIPTAQINLASRKGKSEVGTLQMEYAYLAAALGQPQYAQRALNIYDQVHRSMQRQGLRGVYPVFVGLNDAKLSGPSSLGALGDSFFEYVLKVWKLSGGKVPRLREMYDEMMDAVVDKMVRQTSPSGLWYLAQLKDGSSREWEPKMDELACFAGGGMFAYGAQGASMDRDAAIGAHLAEFCHAMWRRMPSGIAPEYVDIQPGFGWFDGGEAITRDFSPGAHGTHYLLRPETVESFFYMWRLTKEQKYRDWGWEAFQAIEKNCKVSSGGYSGIRDVTDPGGGLKDDLQQSFFLAETLKYLYLLFSDDDSLCNLDSVVFNTEAHPLSVLSQQHVVELFSSFDPRVVVRDA